MKDNRAGKAKEACAAQRVPFHAAAEVVADPGRLAFHHQRAPRGVVPLPDPGGAVVQIAVVAPRREIEAPVCCRCIHSLCDQVVLEGRIQEISDVVYDDVRASVAERFDVGRHLCLPTDTCCKVEFGFRGKVVDDFEHGRAFIASPLLSRQNVHPGR